MSSYRYLVAAPHTLSNIRPVIYNGKTPIRSKKNEANHPYSLEEFTPVGQLDGNVRREVWDGQRQALDAMNHRFWSNSNRRFYLAERRLSEQFPPSCSQEERERILGQFRMKWLKSEAPLQNAYNVELRRQTWRQIGLAAIHIWHDMQDHFSTMFRLR